MNTNINHNHRKIWKIPSNGTQNAKSINRNQIIAKNARGWVPNQPEQPSVYQNDPSRHRSGLALIKSTERPLNQHENTPPRNINALDTRKHIKTVQGYKDNQSANKQFKQTAH